MEVEQSPEIRNRVRCRFCGKNPLVLDDGTVRKHRNERGGLCEGWGQFEGCVAAADDPTPDGRQEATNGF